MKISQGLVEVPRKDARPSSGKAPAASASDATSTPDPSRALESVIVSEELRIAKESHARPTIVDAGRWKDFTDIGLLPSPATKAAQKLLVTTYRLVGLALLTFVVAVLLGYITVTTFYFLNRSWIAPVAISANDEHVVALQSQLAAQLNTRAGLVGELDQAERTIATEQMFQLQFIKAVKKDLAGRRVALGRVRQLSSAAVATRSEIRTTNGDFSESTFQRMNEEYAAGMIDRQAMLTGKYTLAQISNANLALAERQAEFDQRAAELAVQAQSLDAILANKSGTAALSYEILEIARDYEASKLVLARELDTRARVQQSIQRQDQIIDGIKQSAYLRALEEGATVALVPYSNLANAKEGSPLYKCKLDMVLCRKVGKVLEVLPGEVQIPHPARDAVLRGRMIVMEMTERDAAEASVLFAGGEPFGF